MPPTPEFDQLDGLHVHVDDVIYMPNLEAPRDRPHPFVYFISIINRSAQEIRVLGRKWVIRQDNGEWIVVEGAGVVNQQPLIRPGDDFTYNSYHVISGNSVACGAFFGRSETGHPVVVPIPEFALQIPQWAHPAGS